MGVGLRHVFIIGTQANGDLYSAGSGTMEQALKEIAEFTDALSKGKFDVE